MSSNVTQSLLDKTIDEMKQRKLVSQKDLSFIPTRWDRIGYSSPKTW